MLSENDVFEIEVSVCDLVAFFLVAPDIIGREKFDALIDVTEDILMKYLTWLMAKGIIIISFAITAIGMILSFLLMFLNNLDYMSNITWWFGSAIGIAISVPPMLLLAILFFRTHVPRGAPPRSWLLAGSFVFLLARVMTILHALGVIQTGATSTNPPDAHLLWYFPPINMPAEAYSP